MSLKVLTPFRAYVDDLTGWCACTQEIDPELISTFLEFNFEFYFGGIRGAAFC